jgi:FecR-like protein
MSPMFRSSAARSITAIAAAMLVASPILAQATPVGINAALRNKVEIKSAANNKVKAAVLRQQVILNDEVRTADASWLQILLLDKSTFTVGANARIAIDRFVYDPTANSRQTGVSVTRGAFRFMSGRTLGHPSGPATVTTPVAVIGIRGTIFEGVVGEGAVAIAQQEAGVGKVKSDKDVASLIVLRGPGQRTQGDTVPGIIDVTAGGQTVTLNDADLAVYVPRAGVPPIGPFRISSAGLQSLQNMLRPAPEQGGGSTAKTLLGIGAVAAGLLGGGAIGGGKKGSGQTSETPNTTSVGKTRGQ